MSNKYLIALDQGTTSSRAILFNSNCEISGIAQQEFKQYFPKPGWVEHDPLEIWQTQYDVFCRVLNESNIGPSQIAAIGITNQRETTIVWDRKTGKPVCNAIVWQDKRTAPICEQLKSDGFSEHVRERTGLVVDSYFSGTKIKWILDNIQGARDKAQKGELLFGTIDSWLIWNLTKSQVHATDFSNASRTMLYDIKNLGWDKTLLKALSIPESMLPEVRNSSGPFGTFEFKGVKIPIAGVAGDQQAALFGQTCFDPGMVKNTYGTGCFLLMNTGNIPIQSNSGLLSTIAWSIGDKIEYALEGSVMIAGAAVQWLRDGLRIIDTAKETEGMAIESGDTDEVVVVPAFAGLGAPYWDMYARGAIFGLTRDTGREHLAKAVLQSIAFETRDVVAAMQKDTGITPTCLNVDGGASANNYLMQFQADILDLKVERPMIIESTALGAACLAGISIGMFNKNDLRGFRKTNRIFNPAMTTLKRNHLYSNWQKAISRAMNWMDK